MKFRTLNADEIDVRVGNAFSWGYSLLLYKDARCDMNILDETVGAENWQRDHKEIKGNLYCGVAIWDNAKSQWIWKWDCGTESNTEKEKGEASDSFKRACFNLGIGRELYTSPNIAISCEMEQVGISYKIPKEEQKRKFKVKEIEYNDKREITKLVIVDNKNVQVYPKYSIPNTTTTTTQEEQKVYRCCECDEVIEKKVADYSMNIYGHYICRKHQKDYIPKIKQVEI